MNELTGANAYQDEQGKILYMSSDYEKAGLMKSNELFR